MINDSLYGSFRTSTFSDIFSNVNDFINEYKNIGIPAIIEDTDVTTLYYLLYSNYGNSHIASSDPNRFKYKLFSIVWQYGPNWAKQLKIQSRLRELTEDELIEGSKSIYNSANNPGTEPTTDTIDELTYVNNQNVTKHKKSIMEAYGQLDLLLKSDVTTPFINKFKPLFLTIVQPEELLLYEEIK